MSDSTSIIQFKRALDSTSVSTVTPYAGEPIWDMEAHALYIGDGTTAGGILLNTDGTASVHVLIDAGGLPNSQHTIVCSEGDVIIGNGTNTAITRQLNFSDLNSDATGTVHNMNVHSGAEKAIWYSDDTTHASGNGGFAVKNMQYGSLDLTSGGKAVMAYYDTTTASNKLAFRSIGYSDLTGTPPSYTVAQLRSTNGWRAIYSDATTYLQELSFNVPGSVFMSNGATVAPSFKKVGYSDLTGNLTFSGFSSVASDILYYDGSTSSWKNSNRKMSAIIDSTASTYRIYGSSTSKLLFSNYESSDTTVGGILFTKDLLSYSSNAINKLCFYTKTSGTAYAIGFYTKNSILDSTANLEPNVTITSNGLLEISDSNFNNNTSFLTGFTIGRLSHTTSNSTVYGLRGIYVEGIDVTGNNATTASGSTITAFASGDINTSATNNNIADAAQLELGSVSSGKNAFGIKLGNVISRYGQSYGLQISAVESTYAASWATAYGIYINDISGSTATGMTIMGISGTKRVGTYINLYSDVLAKDNTGVDSITALYTQGGIVKFYDNGVSAYQAKFDIDMYLYANKKFIVTGKSTDGTDIISIDNGNILLKNGRVQENIKSIDVNTKIIAGTSDVFPSSVAGGYTTDSIKYLKNIRLVANSTSTGRFSISRIDPGYDGQEITLFSALSNASGASAEVSLYQAIPTDSSHNIIIDSDPTLSGFELRLRVTDRCPVRLVYNAYAADSTDSAGNGKWVVISTINNVYHD